MGLALNVDWLLMDSYVVFALSGRTGTVYL